MNLLHEFPDEEIINTIKYIDQNRNWQVDKQAYKIELEKEILIEMNTNIWQAKIYLRGQYLIIETNKMVHQWEHTIGNKYNFLQQAYELMQPDQSGAWKTVRRLIMFRDALRISEVNHSGYVDQILRGKKLTHSLYNQFLTLSYALKYPHHNYKTF